MCCTEIQEQSLDELLGDEPVLQLQVWLTEGAYALSATARIVWAEERKRGLMMRVSFVGLDEENQERVQRFLIGRYDEISHRIKENVATRNRRQLDGAVETNLSAAHDLLSILPDTFGELENQVAQMLARIDVMVGFFSTVAEHETIPEEEMLEALGAVVQDLHDAQSALYRGDEDIAEARLREADARLSKLYARLELDLE